MNFIIKPRGYGKTYDLIRMSAETGIPIVSMQPDYVAAMAKKHGYEIPTPVSPAQFKQMGLNKVYIDELEFVVEKLIGAKIVCCTMTP